MKKIEASKLPTITTEVSPTTERLITRFRQQVDQENRQRVNAMSPAEARQKLNRYFLETR